MSNTKRKPASSARLVRQKAWEISELASAEIEKARKVRKKFFVFSADYITKSECLVFLFSVRGGIHTVIGQMVFTTGQWKDFKKDWAGSNVKIVEEAAAIGGG